MKIFAIAAAVLATATQTQAWWDNGHMLAGEIASQLMAPEDVATIEEVLSKWEDEFPNTNKIATTAIWPDQLKCKTVQPYCSSPLTPSFTSMDDWHYVDLPVNADGTKWGGMEPSTELFKYSLGGSAATILENSITTLKTTKSTWAVNLVLRNFVHVFSDLHQPLHAVAAISEKHPKGDQGGNYYTFPKGCAFTNLHAMWDSAAGVYSENNWASAEKYAPIYANLQKNATELISWLPIISDAVNLDSYKSLSWDDFVSQTSKNAVIKNIVLDSRSFATNVVYTGLDLTYQGNNIPCPQQSYIDWAAYIAQVRIATAGKRMSVFLTQFAKRIRELGLAK
ncbi:hypothetical protein Poli38472_005662 [Pythium oligandrum]|uniref:Uncharacterized protein n=1 Tax=Pythium oligandrum TaxID=41045 RepID=A0A8K1FJE6_PYTOL|nr:hypothetical protein Poli38472_005662 [Pythium oligandrum]|eukprot:TMW63044.1 hypothetical protein Poli38472_005662 [Pythium oligandrum]